METQDLDPSYQIWGVDQTAYGPVELPTLVNWIKDERVLADTWIFSAREANWLKAAEIAELTMFFRPKRASAPSAEAAPNAAAILKPGELRRIKALAEMPEDQLGTLLKHIDLVQARPFTHVVRKGNPADAMYGVLDGELRSCVVVDGVECPLATLAPGSIFGEISLFDKGPHVADVIANKESLLIQITCQAIAAISREAPDAALGLHAGLIKAVAGRVRTLTRRYENSVHINQKADGVRAARTADVLA